MIHLGKAAKCLRERLGYSQREAGKALGISYPHLNAIENGKASPTAGMIERYYTAWGVDLYMMAVVMFDDGSRLGWLGPKAEQRLRSDWQVHLDEARLCVLGFAAFSKIRERAGSALWSDCQYERAVKRFKAELIAWGRKNGYGHTQLQDAIDSILARIFSMMEV